MPRAGIRLAAEPEASAAPSPPIGEATSTQRLAYRGQGYDLDLPAGWTATGPLVAEWLPGAHPDHYMSGFTTFVPPDNAGFLAVGSRPVEAGTTVDTWQRRLEGAKELAYPYCDPAQQVQPITLGSEPAARLWYACIVDGAPTAGDMLLTVHGTRGWAVICATPMTDQSTAQKTCQTRLQGFTSSRSHRAQEVNPQCVIAGSC